MIVKLINCTVAPKQKNAFSQAQQAWQATTNSRGFAGQWGGWSADHRECQALVLACWQNQSSVDEFMADHHDRIFADSGQRDTYLSCRVGYFNQLFAMPAHATCANSPIKIIRIADCHLLPQAKQHFIDVQRNIWAPGMAAATGMMGGHFCQSSSDANHFIVVTFWADNASHQRYAKAVMPGLRAQAQPEKDIDNISGYVVAIEDDWTVSS